MPTLRDLLRVATVESPFACLTAYDYSTARVLERAGVPLLLVGDSAANVVLGFPSTIHCPLDFLVTLTAAVKRGAPGTVVMADMPFMSYHTGDGEAMRNAGRFMTEGHADIVKLEVDGSFAPLVRQMVRAGIPVCAHIGTRPQAAALTSGPKASGRTADEAQQLAEDARVLQDAGAQMLLIEAVPPETTERVLRRTSVPVIGIGAGTACHGQILVLHDLLGLSEHPPRFADALADVSGVMEQAARRWVANVAARSIGGKTYTMQA